MTRTLLSTLVLALGTVSAWAAHQPHRRGFDGHLHNVHARSPAPRPGRHDYLLNSTFTAQLSQRDNKGGSSGGHATFYHPATEGGAQSSCGQWMNDDTMGVALSQVGWAHFAKLGISEKDLCYKDITIHGLLGNQKARIMDQCPASSSTKTCQNICDIDLTYGLFGLLAKHEIGLFPVTWSFDDGTENPCFNGKGGSSSSSHSTSSSSSHSNSKASSTSSKPEHSHSTSSKAKTAQHAASKTHAHASASKSASAEAETSAKASSDFKTELQWWDNIDPQWCPGVKTPKGAVTAAIGPNKKYPAEKLEDACGKWITITNDQGKSSKAIVVEWMPDRNEKDNFLAIGDAYKDLIVSGSAQVSWGFN